MLSLKKFKNLVRGICTHHSLLFVSFFIVGFGHPTFISSLSFLAATFGYGLFWKYLLSFTSNKKRFWIAVFWFAFVQSIYLSWMTSMEYHGIYILFVYIFLCLFLGLQFGFFCSMLSRDLNFFKIFALTSFWTLIEWARLFIVCGFSLNPVGMALTSNLWSLQSAAVFGQLGLSFWVILVNLLSLRSFLLLKPISFSFFLRSKLWLGLALIPYIFGILYLNYHKKSKAAQNANNLSVVLIQTGLLPDEKIPLKGRLDSYMSVSKQWVFILNCLKNLEKKPDLIVLPEAVVPFNSVFCIYSKDGVQKIFTSIFGEEIKSSFPPMQLPYGDIKTMKVSNIYWAQTLANFFSSELIMGLDHTTELNLNYNSAFHLRPNEVYLDRYDKRILLPLAEYLPFKWLSKVVASYGINEFFSHGKEAHLFKGKMFISPSICYEETFPYLVREGRRKGAQLLVNVTNDGWYPFSRLAKQHLDHAKVRAVENGVALIRACNTGESAIVDSFGTIIAKLEELDIDGNHVRGSLAASFSIYNFLTPYQIWGDFPLILISIFFIFSFFLIRCKNYYSQRRINLLKMTHLS